MARERKSRKQAERVRRATETGAVGKGKKQTEGLKKGNLPMAGEKERHAYDEVALRGA